MSLILTSFFLIMVRNQILQTGSFGVFSLTRASSCKQHSCVYSLAEKQSGSNRVRGG